MLRKRLVQVLLALSLVSSASAEWARPDERYADAYKKYLAATCPLVEDGIQHFVYFSRDRDAIQNHALLTNPRLMGAQIMYSWRELEPTKGNYDFAIIRQDYEYLKSKGKKLFIQLQDTTFDIRYKATPAYLESKEYDGGIVYQYTNEGEPEGWVAKRWNSAVRARFALFLNALGKEFDGKVAGINLQETAIGVEQKYDPTFTPALYAESLKNNMSALKAPFPTSVTMQYANFMPGEWLPWEDKGYLKSIYQHGEKIGVGLGAPDLMVRKKGQLNHALALMHEGKFTAPLGIAVQDGNYIGETNTAEVKNQRPNLVPMLHGFAQDFLRVQYMFWVDQKPYYQEDLLPCLSASKSQP